MPKDDKNGTKLEMFDVASTLFLGDKTSTALAAPVLIMTSFATELATPSVTDERTYVRTPYRV